MYVILTLLISFFAYTQEYSSTFMNFIPSGVDGPESAIFASGMKTESDISKNFQKAAEVLDLDKQKLIKNLDTKITKLINRFDTRTLPSNIVPILFARIDKTGTIFSSDMEFARMLKKFYGIDPVLFTFDANGFTAASSSVTKKPKTEMNATEKAQLDVLLKNSNFIFRNMYRIPFIHPLPPTKANIKTSNKAMSVILPITIATTYAAYMAPGIDADMSKAIGLFLCNLTFASLINYYMAGTVDAITKAGEKWKLRLMLNNIEQKGSAFTKWMQQDARSWLVKAILFQALDKGLVQPLNLTSKVLQKTSNIKGISHLVKQVDKTITGRGDYVATTLIVSANLLVARVWIHNFNFSASFFTNILTDAAIATVIQGPVFAFLGKSKLKGLLSAKNYTPVVIGVNQAVNLLLWIANLGNPNAYIFSSVLVGTASYLMLKHIERNYPEPEAVRLSKELSKDFREIIKEIENTHNKDKNQSALILKTRCFNMHNSLMNIVKDF